MLKWCAKNQESKKIVGKDSRFRTSFSRSHNLRWREFMKKLVWLLCCISVVPLLLVLTASAQTALAAARPSGTATTDQPFVDWTRKHAIPLKTVEAKHGFEDMEPLKKVVGDARIVALGEATHGTREFF